MVVEEAIKTDLYRNIPGQRYNKKRKKFFKTLYKQRYLFLMMLPGLAYYAIFRYIPMYGLIIAFKKYNFSKGILKSEWVGFKYFIQFLQNPYFGRIVLNTFKISISSLVCSFPITIIFALLLNEIRNTKLKKTVQTITYLPHFISLVIIVGLLKQLLSPTTGIVNKIINAFGGQSINFFMEKHWFVPIYVASGIWCDFGWGGDCLHCGHCGAQC